MELQDSPRLANVTILRCHHGIYGVLWVTQLGRSPRSRELSYVLLPFCRLFAHANLLTRDKGPSHSSMAQKTPSLNHVSDQKWRLHLKKTQDPIGRSPATGKSVARIINLFVGDLFGSRGNEMEHRVLTRLRKHFKLVQRIRMMWPSQDKDSLDIRFTKRAVH